jgi:hypothetical protein
LNDERAFLVLLWVVAAPVVTLSCWLWLRYRRERVSHNHAAIGITIPAHDEES